MNVSVELLDMILIFLKFIASPSVFLCSFKSSSIWCRNLAELATSTMSSENLRLDSLLPFIFRPHLKSQFSLWNISSSTKVKRFEDIGSPCLTSLSNRKLLFSPTKEWTKRTLKMAVCCNQWKKQWYWYTYKMMDHNFLHIVGSGTSLVHWLQTLSIQYSWK